MSRTVKAMAVVAERRPSLVDDAYAAMKEAIRESTFVPGYQASEQEIALRLGMSRTPVHEASIRLQEEGLVRIVPKRGIVICALAPDDLREIYDVVIAIEASAAELVAKLPEAERSGVADELAAATARMAEAHAAGRLPDWGKADEAFHRLLVERCGNRRISRIIQTVNDQSHRARMLTLKLRKQLPASIADHQAIIEAIRRGDAAGAHAAARQHRSRARDELLPLLEDFGLKHL
ncbi:GntR family transcriptional regulator [Phreatobacter stygius]|uniref:GntR family transcriptional regulator n=1 Tax=Phreatobacter stygius TaxID=1940610 RepID=A0A4D7BBM3_9HYPH|nr:GntR family transcriptional regulator [Phreatobacter stygius]QCI65437.1 GntR family transcriptional regulator [Phreatobacter stygius]